MGAVRHLAAGLRRLLRRSSAERDLDDEVAHFVAMAARERERAGVPPDEALRAARLELGGVENVKERVRGGGWETAVEGAARDLRYGVRTLRRNRVFTAVVVGTLALGIGANTAVFSVVNTVLLRTLPYRDPDGLVRIWERKTSLERGQVPVSAATVAAWRARVRSLGEIAAWSRTASTLTGDFEPEEIAGAQVSPNLFHVLGFTPELGRAFGAADTTGSAASVVILSHSLWQRRFGGDAGIVGRSITLDHRNTFTVVGVMPEGVRFPGTTEFWEPLRSRGPRAQWRMLDVLARLRPGASLAAASRELTAVEAELAVQDPGGHGGWSSTMESVYDSVVGDVRAALWILFGAVTFVLLIACANVANLFLARASTREREIALRAAIGASRTRLVRQLLTESGLVALLGGGLGLLLARWGVALIAAARPQDIPRLQDLSVDSRVLAFTVLATMTVSLLFGLAPALRLARINLNRALREGAAEQLSGGASLRRPGLRSLLVVSQMTLAVVLLSGAGLMLNSFARLQRVTPGFDPRHAVAVTISPAFNRFPDGLRTNAYYARMLRELSAVPGVRAAGVVTGGPLRGYLMYTPVRVADRPPPAVPGEQRTYFSVISPGYFAAMGTRVLEGRTFSPQDVEGTPLVAVVNRAFVRRYLNEGGVIGRSLLVTTDSTRTVRIIGVVDDIRQYGVGREAGPALYYSYLQYEVAFMDIVVRTTGDPVAVLPSLRARIRAVDPYAPITAASALETIVADSVAEPRFYTFLLAVFAVVGVVLAAVGLYGLVSYSVSRRSHEIGMRISLGARPVQLVRMIVGQGSLLIGIGVVAGVGASLLLTRLLSGLLFGVTPTDPATIATIAALLIAVGLVACWIPARRATRVDPLAALRHE